MIDQFTITKQDTTTPPPAEICNNGADDDGDGKIDSGDPDCQTPTTGYHYAPFFTTTGTNRVDVADSPVLVLDYHHLLLLRGLKQQAAGKMKALW